MPRKRSTRLNNGQQADTVIPAPTAGDGAPESPLESAIYGDNATGMMERQVRRDPSMRETTFEGFKKLGPPNFAGTSEPAEAEIWLRQIEKYYTVLNCTEQQKVAFATFMLIGEADYWW